MKPGTNLTAIHPAVEAGVNNKDIDGLSERPTPTEALTPGREPKRAVALLIDLDLMRIHPTPGNRVTR